MTKTIIQTKVTILIWMVLFVAGCSIHTQGQIEEQAQGHRQMENLNRGVVAIDQGDGKVYIGWRMLGTEPDDIAFNVYRSKTKVNSQPITDSTNLIDNNGSAGATYTVRAVIKGREGKPSAPAKVWSQNYISIPLQTPEGCRPNDASVGDLDGDGEYEIVLKQEMRPRDNARRGATGQTRLEAYQMDGTFMWRINLGSNIREGAHYTQFMVYDLDGDGKAEVACKTADGTVDGVGKTIGDPNANYVNDRGMILDGPEFLTIFNGQTGAELVTTNYIPPRGGDGSAWGDGNGNRVDRFLACIAYLDGQRPSLVMCRGYYTGRMNNVVLGKTVLAAWDFRNGKLTNRWTFTAVKGGSNDEYTGQGNHSVAVADVDGDGKEEIIYGACVIDHDGKGLYSTGLGHGDAQHTSDIDPDRPGLETFSIHENPRHPNGAELRDSRTGEILWGLELWDPGRGLAMDIDPSHKGYECWANSSDGLYNCKGEKISDVKPRSCNMGIWWDGDLLREILDGRGGGRRWGRGSAYIDKWDYASGTVTRLLNGGDYNCVTNNGSKANPCLCADILGDWREEVIWRTTDGKELRIFTTTIPTEHRFYTLMHDPIYRLSVAWQNVAYNQPAHVGFYLGEGMAAPPRPDIKLVNKND